MGRITCSCVGFTRSVKPTQLQSFSIYLERLSIFRIADRKAWDLSPTKKDEKDRRKSLANQRLKRNKKNE